MATTRVGPRRDWAAPAIPAVIGLATLLMVTRRGVDLSPDGLAYIGAARNILHGHAFAHSLGTPAIGHFPPLFPLLLALVSRLGPDPLTAAGWINPFLYASAIFLVGSALRDLTGNTRAALVGAGLVGVSVDVMALNASALSEPLFIVLVLMAFMALARAVERREQNWLVLAALLAGATALTRYIGLATICAGAIGLWLTGRDRKAHGALDITVFTSLALLPLAAWMTATRLIAGGSGDRRLVVHLFGGAYLIDGFKSLSQWVLPGHVWLIVDVAVGVAVMGGLAALASRVVRSRNGRPAFPANRPLPLFLMLFIAVYLVALVVDRSAFDVTGRLDARFFLPVHVLAVVPALHWANRRVVDRAATGRWALAVVGGLVLVGQAFHAATWTTNALSDPLVLRAGFSSVPWKESPVLATLRTLDPRRPVFTNGVDLVYFRTGRATRPIPARSLMLTGQKRPRFALELAEMAEELRTRGGVVVYLEPPVRHTGLPGRSELVARTGLRAVMHDRVATLYAPF